MKKLRKYFVILLVIMSTVTAYGATYTLVTANYPINVNGQKIAVEPLNYNGTTYLPLRQIAEAVGVDIGWNNATKSVEINTVDVEELKKACVMIYANDGDRLSQGSGVYIDYDQILTADHVVSGAKDIKTSGGTKLSINEFNKSIDIAVLKSPDQVKPVKIGDSDELEISDKVLIVSSPKANFNTVVEAIYLGRYKDNLSLWCTELTSGSSGGAVFNYKGELIGIVINGDTDVTDSKQYRNMNATPINDIRREL